MTRALAVVGLALAASSAAGCLHDGLGIPEDAGVIVPGDLGGRSDLGIPLPVLDLSFLLPDLSEPSCTHVDTWTDPMPEVRGSPTESPFDYVTWGRSFDGKTELSVEIWHDAGTHATPYSLSLPGDTNYLLCEVCVLIDENYDAAQGWGSPAYLALGGQVTVTRADTTFGGGELEVSGTNVKLVEWDFTNDRAKPGGACWKLGAFTMKGHYTGDAGDPPRWKF